MAFSSINIFVQLFTCFQHLIGEVKFGEMVKIFIRLENITFVIQDHTYINMIIHLRIRLYDIKNMI